MNSNGVIVTCVGTTQNLFKDRETYPSSLCSNIESVISINSPELSKDGGKGRIRFLDSNGEERVQLDIDKGYSKMSDESKVVILINDVKGSIRSYAYYGIDSELDYKEDSCVYSLNTDDGHVDAIKNFYNAWKINKGEVGAVVILTDRYGVFEKLIKDDFFNKCYVLCSE